VVPTAAADSSAASLVKAKASAVTAVGVLTIAASLPRLRWSSAPADLIRWDLSRPEPAYPKQPGQRSLAGKAGEAGGADASAVHHQCTLQEVAMGCTPHGGGGGGGGVCW
jgi:hypothetical protein